MEAASSQRGLRSAIGYYVKDWFSVLTFRFVGRRDCAWLVEMDSSLGNMTIGVMREQAR